MKELMLKSGETLTEQKLKDMPPGFIFASGYERDTYGGLNMTASGRLLRWAAVRGQGFHDWAIYVGEEDWLLPEIARSGQKVFNRKNILSIVKADEEAFDLYRR